MKSFVLALLVLLTGQLLANQQLQSRAMNGEAHDAKNVILKFLRKVYGTQDDALKIAHHYIRFEDSLDSPSEFTTDKRYEIVAAHITLLRQGRAVGFASPPLTKEELAALRVVPYASLAGSTDNKLLDNKLLNFGLVNSQSPCPCIYVVLKNNIAWKYFSVKKGKIYSFDYLLKREVGPVYLFGY